MFLHFALQLSEFLYGGRIVTPQFVEAAFQQFVADEIIIQLFQIELIQYLIFRLITNAYNVLRVLQNAA